jgi:hypothetical protein
LIVDEAVRVRVAGRMPGGTRTSPCALPRREETAPASVPPLVDQFYSQVQKMGGRRWDTSSLIALLQR